MPISKKWQLYVLISLLAAVLAVGHWQQNKSSFNKNLANNPSNNQNNSFLQAQFDPKTEATTDEEIANANLPASFLIANFPFQTQAPFVNWDVLHEEACEEASVILAAYYLKEKSLSADTMEQEIQKLVQWENDNWNGKLDLTAEEAGQLAKINYNLNYQTIKNTNLTELKKQIAAGHPVIVPAAGRLLGNPNFRGAGPIYHMVVAIGFKDNNIIVQDVGTRNGDHYVYNENIFYNAWHDWAGSPGNIAQGAKNILILTK